MGQPPDRYFVPWVLLRHSRDAALSIAALRARDATARRNETEAYAIERSIVGADNENDASVLKRWRRPEPIEPSAD
jgi:hypothetical protein